MSKALHVILHHSESVDPTLMQWIRERIDHIFGLGASTIVVALGILRVVFPIALVWLARRRRPVDD